jgi:hypothetical protein
MLLIVFERNKKLLHSQKDIKVPKGCRCLTFLLLLFDFQSTSFFFEFGYHLINKSHLNSNPPWVSVARICPPASLHPREYTSPVPPLCRVEDTRLAGEIRSRGRVGLRRKGAMGKGGRLLVQTIFLNFFFTTF